MNVDEKLLYLGRSVKAAEDEVVMAAMFHETWKPAAYDEELRVRMGHSFATHSFHIVRIALRREMILALMRLWDSNKKGIRMSAIASMLEEKELFDSIVIKRAVGMNMVSPEVSDAIRETLAEKRDKVLVLVRKYLPAGASFPTLEKIRSLRHERLAHRQTEPATANRDDANDKEIESFYDDTLELVRLLLSLVLGHAFDITQAVGVYRHHANFFWANARGERTEGHPNYRPPVSLSRS